MDFFVPFDQIGVSPPGAWQNASPQASIKGSIVNALVFPAVQGEILKVQDEAGLTRNVSDNTQLMQAIRSGKLNYFVDVGTADALVVNATTAFTAINAGQPFTILKNSAPNATTTPTLTVNGLSRTLVKEDGSAIAVGDLPGGVLFCCHSDGTNIRVLGLRKSDAVVPILPTEIWHWGNDSSTDATKIVAAVGSATPAVFPAVTTRQANAAYLIFPGHNCIGATTLDVGFGPIALKRLDGSALIAGDYAVSQPIVVIDDGTVFRLTGLTINQISSSLTNVFVSKVTSAASAVATYGMSANQSVSSNVSTAVALTGGSSPFTQIAGGGIQVTVSGRYFLTGTLLADTFQPSGELQYSSLLIYKNGGLLTQTIASNYSYGEILVALNVGTATYLSSGDILNLYLYTHSQNNDDHNDVIQASSTSFTIVFLG